MRVSDLRLGSTLQGLYPAPNNPAHFVGDLFPEHARKLARSVAE